MLNTIISIVLSTIVISTFFSLAYAASKKLPKEDENKNKILKSPVIYSILGFVFMIGGLFIMIYAFFINKQIEKTFGIIFTLLIFIPGSFIFFKSYFAHLIISNSSIIEVSTFGKQKEIKWEEIKNISFNKTSKELSIKSNNKQIKAHYHLVGFNTLVEQLESKTGQSVKNLIIIKEFKL